MSEERKPTKSYILSPEALEAIDDLNDAIKDKGKSQIVSEAIVQMALAHGIKVKGRKKRATLESLEKKTKQLDKVMESLCRLVFAYECDEEGPVQALGETIQEAVDSGVRRNANALWKAKSKDFPECVRSKDALRVYLKSEGKPKK